MVKLIYIFLGCHGLGRSEKLDWEFVFRVEGTTCSIASEKFGLRVYVDRNSVAEEAEAKRLFQRILLATIKGQKVVEKDVLEPISKEHGRLGARREKDAPEVAGADRQIAGSRPLDLLS
jgi:hypothetical protein